MHPLHQYVAKQLAEKLKSRKVAIWYDARDEFVPFIEEVRDGPRASNEPVATLVDGVAAHLGKCAGSMFELRAAVEPLAGGDKPDASPDWGFRTPP